MVMHWTQMVVAAALLVYMGAFVGIMVAVRRSTDANPRGHAKGHSMEALFNGLASLLPLVTAIATPGHTPGAMSYLVDGRVLFTGDTLALRNGHVRTFYRLTNLDTTTREASIGKVARLGGVSLLCTAHTGCTTVYARATRQWRESR